MFNHIATLALSQLLGSDYFIFSSSVTNCSKRKNV